MAVYSFDTEETLSFGITDYTDFEGMKYDPRVGTSSAWTSTSRSRALGTGSSEGRIMKRKIPRSPPRCPGRGYGFMKEKFNVEVVE